MTGWRVLANLCSIVPGRVGGSEEYATRLLAATAAGSAADRGGFDFEIAAMRGTRQAHENLVGLVWHEAGWSGRLRPLRLAVESSWLPRISAGFDLVHHFGGRLPARHDSSAVLTIHDIQPVELPGNFSLLKRRYFKRVLPRSLRRAALIVTPSHWSAQRIIERFGVAPERICVVPSTWASRPESAPTHPPADTPSDAVPPRSLQALQALDLQARPFILYPAFTHSHKNHAMLIAAHAELRRRSPEVELLLTGGQGRLHREVTRLAAGSPGVTHLGWVAPGELDLLIRRAAVVAFPSRYEGFGLPVLEAMHAATPVVAADVTALPEVVGDGGTLVDPDDIDGWIEAMADAVSLAPEARRKVESGRARAESYAPDKVAASLIMAWRAALEGPD